MIEFLKFVAKQTVIDKFLLKAIRLFLKISILILIVLINIKIAIQSSVAELTRWVRDLIFLRISIIESLLIKKFRANVIKLEICVELKLFIRSLWKNREIIKVFLISFCQCLSNVFTLVQKLKILVDWRFFEKFLQITFEFCVDFVINYIQLIEWIRQFCELDSFDNFLSILARFAIFLCIRQCISFFEKIDNRCDDLSFKSDDESLYLFVHILLVKKNAFIDIE
jgi:hypothetical protein